MVERGKVVGLADDRVEVVTRLDDVDQLREIGIHSVRGGVVEALFVAEVVAQRRRCDARDVRDGSQRCARVAEASEGVTGRAQRRLPSLFT